VANGRKIFTQLAANRDNLKYIATVLFN